MHRAAHAQSALDDFLAHEVSESDLCEILDHCSVNVDEFAGIVQDNLRLMGF